MKKKFFLFFILWFVNTKNMENNLFLLDEDQIPIVPYFNENNQLCTENVSAQKIAEMQNLYSLIEPIYPKAYSAVYENIGNEHTELQANNNEPAVFMPNCTSNFLIIKKQDIFNNVSRGRVPRFQKLLQMKKFTNEQNNKEYVTSFFKKLFDSMFPGHNVLCVDTRIFDTIVKKDAESTKHAIHKNLKWSACCPGNECNASFSMKFITKRDDNLFGSFFGHLKSVQKCTLNNNPEFHKRNQAMKLFNKQPIFLS